MGQGNAVRVPLPDERRDHVRALVVSPRALKADAVHPAEAAVLDDLLKVSNVVRVVRMADDDASEVAAFLPEHALLVEARAVRGEGVRADWHAGLAVRAGALAQDALVHGVHRGLGRALDDVRADAGFANTHGDVAHEQVRHRTGGPTGEVERTLVVEPGWHDHLHPGLAGGLRDEHWVSPEIDWREVDHRLHAGRHRLLKLLNRLRHATFSLPKVRVGLVDSGPAHSDMFMHEREAHVCRVDGACRGLNRCHVRHLGLLIGRSLPYRRRCVRPDSKRCACYIRSMHELLNRASALLDRISDILVRL